MILRVPDYYSRFRCLAGSCPRSCCIGWEVEIDEASAESYASVPGALGEALRAQLKTDDDGALCFPLLGERCPFLDEENLCRIHRTLGQEYTSVTCREHPRFTEDFGPLREISLSASCPEAARLLLEGDTPLTFPEEQLRDCEEEGDPWLEPLLTLRDTAMSLLRNASLPVRHRMAQVLNLAIHAQSLLDGERPEMLPRLCREFPPMPIEIPAPPPLFPSFLHVLAELEILERDWLPLLRAADASGGELPEITLERLTEYFLFRWLLKAVNDGDLLGRVQLSIVSALTVERLSAHVPTPTEALYRYCREIEHCQENIDSLLELFRWQEEFLPEFLLQTLQNV